jgi:flagellar basal-body rod modification protein FlgD
MDGLQMNSVGGVGSGASSTVASALAPRRRTAQAAPKDTQATGAATNGHAAANAATGASDITSNDFLTLLVSELKNQDPTQPTDPNAYIQQLVGVNSLQQLIQINQGLTAIEVPVTDGSTGATTGS